MKKEEKSGASLSIVQHGDSLLASSVVARMVLQLVQFSQHAAVHSRVDDFDDTVGTVYGTNEIFPFLLQGITTLSILWWKRFYQCFGSWFIVPNPDRIQHFRLNTNPDLQLKKIIIFDQKLQPIPRIDFQAIGEAFSPQKRTSSTSNHEMSDLFSIFMGHFCPRESRSRSTDLNEFGSGSETLVFTYFFSYIRRS